MATAASRSRSYGSRSGSKARSQSKARSFSLTAVTEMDRVHLLITGCVAISLILLLRLFSLQVLQYDHYSAIAEGQYNLVQKLVPHRGEIYAKDPYEDDGLALVVGNQTLQRVYANPKALHLKGKDPQETARIISPLLGLDPELITARLSKKDDIYEPIKHDVTEQEIAALELAIEEHELVGIQWSPEEARYYPEGEIIASLSGFVGLVDDAKKGQYGLEGYFDEDLAGEEGSLNTQLDSSGRRIATGENSIVEAQDGDMLILTIDKNIQYTACSMLQAAVDKHQADSGTVIIMNPKTGAIMAMCDAPTYDPNDYGNVEDIAVYKNDAVTDQWEPGSVFKPLAVAAAINEGKLTPDTTYEDTGEIIVGGFPINNSDGASHGVVDMVYVLEFSLNTGSIFAVQQIGNEKWHEYVEKFGFGKRTGISLSGENPGDISQVATHRDVYAYTASFGQGMTATPLQMIQSYAALANGGTIMKPYVVDRIVKSNGYQQQTEPEVLSQAVSAETARTVSAMLVRVIDGGHASLAAVDGYFMAGKTGTAQIVNENGVYDGSRHKDTFVGYGPVADPEFVILTKIDEPKDVPWSALSAAPLFGDIAQYLVNYMQIPQDRLD